MKLVLPFVAAGLISESIALPTARPGDLSYREQAHGSLRSELVKRQDSPPVGDPSGSSNGVLIASAPVTNPGDNSNTSPADVWAAAGGVQESTNNAASGGNDWFPWMRMSSSSLWGKRWSKRSAQPEAAQSQVVGDTLVTDFTASGDSSPSPPVTGGESQDGGRDPALFRTNAPSYSGNDDLNITGHRVFAARARQRVKNLYSDLHIGDLIARRSHDTSRHERREAEAQVPTGETVTLNVNPDSPPLPLPALPPQVATCDDSASEDPKVATMRMASKNQDVNGMKGLEGLKPCEPVDADAPAPAPVPFTVPHPVAVPFSVPQPVAVPGFPRKL